jgi:DNA polymerase III alpha subunit
VVRSRRDAAKHHLTLIAQTPEGYRTYVKLVTKSWQRFYYDPLVTWNDLSKHKEGLSSSRAAQGSLLFCSTVGGKNIPEEASYRRGLQSPDFQAEFGDNYFIEVQAFPKLELASLQQARRRLARAVGREARRDEGLSLHVLEEAEVQKILHNLRPGNKQTIEEQARDWGYNVADSARRRTTTRSTGSSRAWG